MYIDSQGRMRMNITLNGKKKVLKEHRINALINYSLHDVLTHHVHHENGCCLDNSPNNLTLVTHEEHNRIHKYMDYARIVHHGEKYDVLYNSEIIKSGKDYDYLDNYVRRFNSLKTEEEREQFIIDNNRVNLVEEWRIVKAGFKNGKQNYKLMHFEEEYKNSIFYDKLDKIMIEKKKEGL